MTILKYFTSLEVLVPLAIGIFFNKRIGDFIAKPFIFYLLVLSFLEVTCLFLSVKSINNHLIYNLIDFTTILFFVYYFSKFENKLFFYFSITISITAFFNILLRDPFVFKQSNYLMIYAFIGTTSSYLLFEATKLDDLYFFKSFRFWFYTGFIVSSFSTLTMYIFFDKIKTLNQSSLIVQYYSFFNFVINSIQYAAFSIDTLCRK